ncbi:MAG: hypothetical protein K8J08_01100 [Thermoanaerobaculia bacterium]|nr:hypothetical protein [Thermoanaerobaculia bacterium]
MNYARTLCTLLLMLATSPLLASGTAIDLEVDARQLPKKLLHATLRIPVTPERLDDRGVLTLDYPLFIPGTHAPSGPIENVAGFAATDCQGQPTTWLRNPLRPESIEVTVPEECDEVTVTTTYIASQPNVNSRGVDSYGWADLGAISFNTVLWVPAGESHQDVRLATTVRLPAHWTGVAGSLPHTTKATSEEVIVTFEEATLAELVDAPMIAGRNLVTLELDLPGHPPHTFNAVSKELVNATPPDWMKGSLEEMVRQAALLMGHFPRRRFDFLHVFAPGISAGLEHGESTLMGDDEDTLVEAVPKDDLQAGGDSITVIPHEYVHAWCGKLTAPEGLVPSDFNAPIRSEMLWVYEGLTSYLDELLAVRSNWVTFEEFQHHLLRSILSAEGREGRRWRPLEDTAADSRNLRGRSARWGELRRRQDYYAEGALFWLEADARIRRGTQGERSLDDFVRSFFDVPVRPVGDLVTYTRDTVVEKLHAVYPDEDWDGLIRARIESPQEDLSMTHLLEQIGYQLDWQDDPTALQKVLDKKSKERIDVMATLGFAVDDGVVENLAPGGLADQAGIPFDAEIVGVAGWRYSKDRFEEALKATPESGQLDLLVDIEGQLKPFTLSYDGGVRHPHLVPVDADDDLLRKIAEPLSGS